MSRSEAVVRVVQTGAAFPVAIGDTILRAGLRAGHALPYECAVGSCGTCKFQLVAGAVEATWPAASAVTQRDAARGRHLACQSRPLQPCAVRFLSWPPAPLPVTPSRRTARLVHRTALSPGMTLFRFRAEAPAAFRPGQFALLGFDGVAGDRAFSMSNLPNGDGEWEFIVRREQGPGTAALFALAPGAGVSIDGPYGHAYVRDSGAADRIICVAGGSGLAPMLAIGRQILASGGKRRLDFIHAARTAADLCLAEEIGAWPGANPAIRVTPILSEPGDAGWDGVRGFAHQALDALLSKEGGDADIHMAGPPPMIDAAMTVLRAHAVPDARIHFDRFY